MLKPAFPGVSLPRLGDNLVQLELDLPHYYGLAWQSLICCRLVTLIRSGPTLLSHLSSVTSDLPCFKPHLAVTDMLAGLGCCHGPALVFHSGAHPAWLPAPLSFPSSLPLLLPDVRLQTGENMNCFLLIFIAQVGNKMSLWKGISIK